MDQASYALFIRLRTKLESTFWPRRVSFDGAESQKSRPSQAGKETERLRNQLLPSSPGRQSRFLLTILLSLNPHTAVLFAARHSLIPRTAHTNSSSSPYLLAMAFAARLARQRALVATAAAASSSSSSASATSAFIPSHLTSSSRCLSTTSLPRRSVFAASPLPASRRAISSNSPKEQAAAAAQPNVAQ